MEFKFTLPQFSISRKIIAGTAFTLSNLLLSIYVGPKRALTYSTAIIAANFLFPQINAENFKVCKDYYVRCIQCLDSNFESVYIRYSYDLTNSITFIYKLQNSTNIENFVLSQKTLRNLLKNQAITKELYNSVIKNNNEVEKKPLRNQEKLASMVANSKVGTIGVPNQFIITENDEESKLRFTSQQTKELFTQLYNKIQEQIKVDSSDAYLNGRENFEDDILLQASRINWEINKHEYANLLRSYLLFKEISFVHYFLFSKNTVEFLVHNFINLTPNLTIAGGIALSVLLSTTSMCENSNTYKSMIIESAKILSLDCIEKIIAFTPNNYPLIGLSFFVSQIAISTFEQLPIKENTKNVALNIFNTSLGSALGFIINKHLINFIPNNWFMIKCNARICLYYGSRFIISKAIDKIESPFVAEFKKIEVPYLGEPRTITL